MIFCCDGVSGDNGRPANSTLIPGQCHEGCVIDDATVTCVAMGNTMYEIFNWVETKLGQSLPSSFVDKVHAEIFAAFCHDLQNMPGLLRLWAQSKKQVC